MELQRIETKFASADVNSATGTFSGYGAVFGNVDSHKDVIQSGAFRASLSEWRAKGRLPRMLLMHGSNGNPFSGDDLPIGVWTTMCEDSRGLYVEGRLLALDTDYGRRILSLMKGGALDGLSIGFIVKRASPGTGTAKRFLEAIDLREVSIVDEPSNDLARVDAMKESVVTADLEGAYAKMQKALRAMAADMKVATADDGLDGLAARIRAMARSK